MAIIQIPRLRSQINAVAAHYGDSGTFISALKSLLINYSRNKHFPLLIEDSEQELNHYDLAEVVMVELESAFIRLAKNHPQEAIEIADRLWREPVFEQKKLAIILVSHLGNEYGETFVQHVDKWIDEDLEDKLLNEILDASEQIPFIVTSKKWLDLIYHWLNSSSRKLIRNGLKALGQLISRKDFQDMPYVFGLLFPVFSQPDLAIQKNLLNFTSLMAEKTPSETASFLISVGEIYPQKQVRAFIRKCLPFFDEYFQKEIKQSIR